MVKVNGAALLTQTLLRAQVRRVYGVPAPTNVDAWEALRRGGIATVVPKSDSAAIIMALSEATVSGLPGTVLLGAGPGLTAAITGIAECRFGGVPLLIVVSIPDADDRAFRLHDVDHEALARPLVKGTLSPRSVAEIPETLAAAHRMASEGEPGPVLVLVPEHQLRAEMKAVRNDPVVPPPPVRDPDHEAKVAQTVDLIRASRRIGIYAGRGACSATAEIAALAEALEAPVASTISGRGVLPDSHPLSVGYGYGLSSASWVQSIFKERELILAIGTRFSEVATGGYGLPPVRRIVQVDVNPAHLGASFSIDLGVTSDASLFLQSILGRLDRMARDGALRRRIERGKRRHAASLSRALKEEGVQPEVLFARLRSRLPANAMLALDGGRPAFWALHAFAVERPNTLLLPADFGAMGFAVPAAIGAKLCEPAAPVLAVTGDTSFAATALEVQTATLARLGIPVLLLEEQIAPTRRREARSAIDYRALAQACGARAVRISNDFELDAGLDAALRTTDRPTLVHLTVLYDRLDPYSKGALAAEPDRPTLGGRVRRMARSFARRIWA